MAGPAARGGPRQSAARHGRRYRRHRPRQRSPPGAGRGLRERRGHPRRRGPPADRSAFAGQGPGARVHVSVHRVPRPQPGADRQGQVPRGVEGRPRHEPESAGVPAADPRVLREGAGRSEPGRADGFVVAPLRPPASSRSPEPKKKGSKTVPILIGAAVLGGVGIAVAAGGGGGGDRILAVPDAAGRPPRLPAELDDRRPTSISASSSRAATRSPGRTRTPPPAAASTATSSAPPAWRRSAGRERRREGPTRTSPTSPARAEQRPRYRSPHRLPRELCGVDAIGQLHRGRAEPALHVRELIGRPDGQFEKWRPRATARNTAS